MSWAFEVTVTVSGMTTHSSPEVRAFALERMRGNAAARGKVVDEASLVHHAHPAFPGFAAVRVWRAKELPLVPPLEQLQWGWG